MNADFSHTCEGCEHVVTEPWAKDIISYGRLVEEMDAADENSPYYFDEAVGERPIIFVERFCKQSQGTLGESLTLELFQKAYIQLLFGWLERATGYRRFRETLFLVGRKNGKSTLLAALALYMLVADYEGAAEIYSVATKKDQAKKTLTEAVNMVKQSPELSAILKKRRNDIYFPATASKFEALASDSNTLDGLNSHAVIIDELHAIRDRNLYEVMKQSTSSRRQPLVIMITTSGTVRESVFDNLYGYACEVADGQTPDERFLPVLYELDKREEWTDPTAWIKANPGLGTIKQYTTLADFVERAKKNPEDLPGVLCKDFNVKATGAASWLSYEDAVNEATFKPEEVYNTYAIGGCDLSATTDLTCATLIIRRSSDDEIVYVFQHYFLPQKKIDQLDEHNTQEAPYKIWAERGLVTICEGMPQIITGIVSALGEGVSQVAEVGANLVRGLWQGIQSLAGWLWDKVSGWISSIWDGITDFFGIHSPSTKMAWVSEMNVEGAVVGIEKNKSKAVKAYGAMGEEMLAEVDSGLAAVNDKLKSSIGEIETGFSAKATVEAVSASVPADLTGRGGGATTSGGGDTNVVNHFHIAELVVREEADVKKISRELYNMQKSKSRSKGVSMA